MTLTNAFTWEDLPTTSTKGETTMAAMIPRIQKTVKQMLISVMAFHGSYIVVRLVNSEQRVLTANSFYLFDVSSSPVYEVILLSQIMAAAFYMVLFFGMWGLYATLVCIACSQLEKLRANLLDIRQEHKTQEQDSGAETDTEEEEIQVHTSQEVFRRMQGELKDCVRHHQQILRFMKAMEDTLHPVLLGLFFIATGCICLSGFSVVMNWGEVMPMSQAALIYFAMMFFLFAFCRLGEELTHQAKSVRDAVWESNWVGAPVPFQHSLIIINIIASKKFSLTAGKFVPVSNKTMLSVRKSIFTNKAIK
ncbi:hypothetical protein B7P43_G09269 [Cryptotermes secundus]|uniref:Odorant receptor n=1 Tax=Cryptotermes secundus TaxID=105785 RepID=A0A2J7R2S7_9NEOP|nr:hypothetical protein B7P43_G09269 [Cryptotermes secundus]